MRRERVEFISYPKAGRTWLRMLLGKALILHYQLPVTYRSILEPQALCRVDARIPPVVFSHDNNAHLKRVSQMPKDKSKYRKAEVVFLARDPRDILVSMYFQESVRELVLRDGPGFHGSIEEFIHHETFGIENIITFLNIWAANQYVPLRFLLIRYEDMIEDAARELRRLLVFLNTATDISSQTLAEAVEFCKFENMHYMEATNAMYSKRLRPTDVNNPESYKVRRGKVGGYRDYLNSGDVAYVDRLVAEELDDFFGYGGG